MTEQNSIPTKKTRTRSPSYPAVPLSAAIARAKELYDKERQHPIAVETLVKHWGYKSLNGPAASSLATLKKFGLVTDDGSGSDRQVRVTDLAVDILANPSEAAKESAIKRAALLPAVHREMWDKYQTNLPSDESLRWELTRQRGFSETGADEFIPEYRHTIVFAKLQDGASVPIQEDALSEESEPDDGNDKEDTPPPPPRKRQVRRMTDEGARSLTIPLIGGTDVIVEGDFPISEQDWDQFVAVLTAMKPGLVQRQETPVASSRDGRSDLG